MYEGEFTKGNLEVNGKWIYENGNYYIGLFINRLRNGKGILYYKKGNIIYFMFKQKSLISLYYINIFYIYFQLLFVIYSYLSISQ